MTLDGAIAAYFRSDTRRQYAPGTRYNHRRALRALVAVCGGDRAITRITTDHVSEAIQVLRDPSEEIEKAVLSLKQYGKTPRRGRREISLNNDRSALRQFVRFLHDEGHLPRDINPVVHLRLSPKVRSKTSARKKPLAREAVPLLLDLAGQRHPRDRAAVALAVLGGLRESEILCLTWGDVVWDGVHGPLMDFYRPKRKDAHRVALAPMLMDELRAWHRWYAARHPDMKSSWYVIPARQWGYTPPGSRVRGTKMFPDWPIVPDRKASGVRKQIKPFFAQIGVTDLSGKGMHTLRRTAAQVLLEDTGSIRVVKELLGHELESTTEEYLDNDHDFEVASAHIRRWNPYAPRTYAGNVVQMRGRPAS